MPEKAQAGDFLGRFREIISDPLNLLIRRCPLAGVVEGDEVHLHNGVRVPVAGPHAYYGAFSQILIVNRGVHEPLEEYAFQEMLGALPAAPIMVELGAYWGHYSMWLKKERPQATAILVEPDPTALAAGIHNFKRNGFEGEFIQDQVAPGNFELDAFMQKRALSRLDVVHADVQGAETDLLAGGRRTLAAGQIDFLLISTHSQAKHEHVIRYLADAGYRIEASSDFESETTAYDGFVFAASPRVRTVFRHFRPLGRKEIANSSPQKLLHSVIHIEEAKATAYNRASSRASDFHLSRYPASWK